ncbi:MAG: D-inositol-3-phosphate glycosyltransferase [Gemmatimonadaceae bacterium]|nr:D-inositol-3-phosphate glycosyltransferase [Gemmatimonadaceae bacterium]
MPQAPPERPLRVLILADHIGGGTGQHILSLASAFDPGRASVQVMSEGRVHGVTPAAQRVRQIPRLSRLHRFPFAQVHTVLTLVRTLRREPVDVLHTYGLWPVLYGRLLKRLGIVDALVENREDDGHIWGPRPYPLLRATRGIPDRVIAVSHAVAEHVATNEGLDDRVLVAILNGATRTESRYSRESARDLLGIPHDAFVVAAVASNVDRPVKGVRYLVAAFSSVAAALPHARLLLLGDRLPDSAVARDVADRGMTDRVIFAGYRDDVSDLYPAMDLLVMPSLSEGLPIALLEAMRHGVPAVATRVGGTPEVLLDGVTGSLVAPMDETALADSIVLLARDDERRGAFGRAASARYEAVFNIEHVARAYERVYAEVAGGARDVSFPDAESSFRDPAASADRQ